MSEVELLTEITEFMSPGEYLRFLKYIERKCVQGELIEVPPHSDYGKGEIFGGRWFKHVETGSIWRLKEPDFPFRGMWEKVIL